MNREVPQVGLVCQVPILDACVPIPELPQACGGVPVQGGGAQLLGDVYDVARHLRTGRGLSWVQGTRRDKWLCHELQMDVILRLWGWELL